METEAIFDKEKDEWIINSPKISSAKFWPGDLGKVGTHSVLYAQMIINGQKMGVQAFLIPIRDPETHRPFQGIEVGDIGPKFGFHAKDNGYMLFTNYRVPRRALLMRYLKVDKEGNFEPQGNPKILYSVMMFTRLQLLTMSCN